MHWLTAAMVVLCTCAPLVAQHSSMIDPMGYTVEARFKPPEGYKRIEVETTSFAHYLRGLRMLSDGASAIYHDGTVKPNHNIYAGVLDLDMGVEGLQKEAQFCMRLRGEYLFGQGQYAKIAFTVNNSSRKRVSYVEWAEGLEMIINDQTYWTKQPADIDRYRTFRRYLEFIFTYSDITTLLADVQSVTARDIMPGDMLVQSARPGHVVIVLDVAENPVTGDRVFLLAQSYRPAQTPQVLINPADNTLSPWYGTSITEDKISTPEYVFYKRDLRRFRDPVATPPSPKKKNVFYF